jgi:type I restriction enzyme, S subunit
MVNGKLPDGWTWAYVEDLSKNIQYGYTESANDKPVGPKFLRITDIQDGKVNWDTVPYCECSDEEAGRYLLASGDIVFARTGATTGKSFLITNPPKAVFASYLIRLRLQEAINTKYFSYFLDSPDYWSQIMQVRKGSAQPGVNATILTKLKVPVAPLPEQERIVAKIEVLFTQLEAGTSALEKVQAGLRRYKASVLKAAVEGKLGIQNDEGGMKNGGLPYGWRWTTVGEIADHRLGKMLDKEKNKGTPRPYLRNINVRWFEFDFSDIQEMRVLEDELENISIQNGDLIVCEGGEPGRAAVWNKNESMVIQKALHRVRTNDNVLPTYLMYCLAADANSGKLERYFTGSTIKHFTGQSLENYKFLLPPLEEQRQIVAEVERRLSVAREVESVVEKALARAARLRQAVLKSAFEGKLA